MLEHSRRRLESGVVVHRWRPLDPADRGSVGVSRPAVLVQHGYLEYSERYVGEHQGIVPRLVDAGFDVWAMDLWGHGDSPGRRGVLSANRAVEDHLAVRRLLTQRHAEVVLLGHSLGGFLTAASVVRDPDVAGVVLLSPVLDRPVSNPLRWLVSAGAELAPGAPVPRRRRPVSSLSRVPEVAARAMSDPRMKGRQVGLLLAATVLRQSECLWSALRTWAAPTVVAHGTGDTISDPAASAELVSAISADDKEFWPIAGAFHELLNERSAADLVERIVRRTLRWVR